MTRTGESRARARAVLIEERLTEIARLLAAEAGLDWTTLAEPARDDWCDRAARRVYAELAK